MTSMVIMRHASSLSGLLGRRIRSGEKLSCIFYIDRLFIPLLLGRQFPLQLCFVDSLSWIETDGITSE